MQRLLIDKQRQAALVSQEILLPQDFFLRGKKTSFRFHLQIGTAPAVFYNLKRLSSLSLKVCHHDFRPWKHIFHRLLLMHGNEKFLHVMHISRISGKTFVQISVFPVLPAQNPQEIR